MFPLANQKNMASTEGPSFSRKRLFIRVVADLSSIIIGEFIISPNIPYKCNLQSEVEVKRKKLTPAANELSSVVGTLTSILVRFD